MRHPLARIPVLALVTALAFGLAGCGGEASTDGDGGTASGAFPVTIPNTYGETVVEKRPARVVSIGFHEHDILLALGVRPVAVQQWMAEYKNGIGPWATPLLGDAKPKMFPSTAAELNMGEIAKLKPDLIVGTYREVSRSDYELLSKMAPTLVRPKGYVDYAVPYEIETKMIGKALGKEKEANSLVAAAEKKFADARKAHPEFEGRTAAIAYPMENGGLGIYNSGDPRGEFLRKLGFTIPKAVDEAAGDKFYTELSPERLDLVGDVDVLLIIDFGLPKDLYAKNALFQRLDVAKRGNYVYPLPYTNAVSHNDVVSIPYCIDKVVPVIAKTLEK
ncbi:MAG: ABC transporter substrate-binding protein [Streptosporangiales bacterium]|nr:ABC transporter substrate-binding protein [Streptosporangiales bacterium]